MRHILALIGALSCAPALALDVFIDTTTRAAGLAVFAKLGRLDAKTGQPIMQGSCAGDANAMGSYFVVEHGIRYAPDGATTTDPMGNKVPAIVAHPGYWWLLRENCNGNVAKAYAAGTLGLPPGITIYTIDTAPEGLGRIN